MTKLAPYRPGEVKPKGKKPTHPWRVHVDRPPARDDKKYIPSGAMMGLKI